MGLLLAGAMPMSSETVRQRVITTLSASLDSEVELTHLQVRVVPRFHVVGSGLTVRHRGRHDVPPLISIKALTIEATVIGLLRKHVGLVALEGLESNIPPDRGWPGDQGSTTRTGRMAVTSTSFDHPMPFDAVLTNAIPPGEIVAGGSFGPWQVEEPGATPLDGTFTFEHADLSVFKGISGILSAHGEFGGSLGRLGVHA